MHRGRGAKVSDIFHKESKSKKKKNWGVGGLGKDYLEMIHTVFQASEASGSEEEEF